MKSTERFRRNCKRTPSPYFYNPSIISENSWDKNKFGSNKNLVGIKGLNQVKITKKPLNFLNLSKINQTKRISNKF